MIDVILNKFPMPPSVNEAYMPVIGRLKFNKNGKPYGAGRMIKTKKYLEYESVCTKWELAHQKGLKELKSEIINRRKEQQLIGKDLTLMLQLYAVFPKETLFTEKGKAERIDSDNRIKLSKDLISRALMIDDKLFFKDEIQKVYGDSTYMIARITEYEPKSEQQIKSILCLK